MHIAFLIPTIDRIGGAEQQVILLAKGLCRRGHRVTLIALSGSGGDAAADLNLHGVQFLSLRMRKGLADPRGWSNFHQWIKAHHPDVLHAHLPHAILIARWSRLAAPLRVLIETIHSPSTGPLFRKLCYFATACQPDAVTAVSCAAAQPWLQGQILNESKLTILPNGIDLEHWHSDHAARLAIRKELEINDSEFVWLSVGRLDPVKDHTTLLRAFARLSSNARLLIAGTGALKNKLQRLAVDLHLELRVNFLGFQPNVLRWMHVADAFVLCSRWEGLPLTLLESSACELPAVLTDIPAVRELLPASLSSSLVPVSDPHALAQQMQNMMQLSEVQRRRLGCAMRSAIAEKFSFDSTLTRCESLYRDLLATRIQPARSGRILPADCGRTFHAQ